MVFRIILIIFFIASHHITIAAINKVDYQFASWNRFQVRWQVNKKFHFTPEIDQRFFLTNFYSQFQFVQRSVVGYQLNQTIEFSVGYAFFLNRTNSPERATKFAIPEIRPQQDVFFRHEKNKIAFQHRFRLEQRFIKNANANELIEGYRFAFRTRYQFMKIIDLKKWETKRLRAVVFEEIFLQFQKNNVSVFDQFRISVGLRYEWKKSNITLTYMNQFQQTSVKNNFINRGNVMIQYSILIASKSKN